MDEGFNLEKLKIHERLIALEITIKNQDRSEEIYRIEERSSRNEIIKLIKEQNGRVRANEAWRYITVGGLSVICTLIIPIIFILLKSYLKV